MKKLLFLIICLMVCSVIGCAGGVVDRRRTKSVLSEKEDADEMARRQEADSQVLYEMERQKRAATVSEGSVGKEEPAADRSSAAVRADGAIEEPAAESAPVYAAVPPPSDAERARVHAHAAPVAVKAGVSDDNQQFNYYLHYLERFANLNTLKLDISNRIIFTLRDSAGKSLPNCQLTFRSGAGQILAERQSYADGRVMFFPSENEAFRAQGLNVRATCLQQTQEQTIDPQGIKTYELKFAQPRQVTTPVPLDIVFLFDTTASMSDEIERLKLTLDTINFQIGQMTPKPDLRLAMVLYRDRSDAYLTKIIPFSADIAQFKTELSQVQANGGGDDPEDIQSGLQIAVNDLPWRKDALRLLFLIGDAPPHLDYGQTYNYIQAMQDAARGGIKIVSIGASGLSNDGEYIFRQLAQYSMGIFVFLTYGETGEAEGGGTAAVSHHTGANWQSENLDAIVVKIVKKELAYLSPQPIQLNDDYFETTAQPNTDKNVVLAELFDQGMKQLLDYAVVRIEEHTPSIIMPITISNNGLKVFAELLEDQWTLALARFPQFQLLERQNIPQLLAELKLQSRQIFDERKVVEAGKLAGAQLAFIGKLRQHQGKLELFIKLVRIETGEVLAVTLLKIDDWLRQP